MKKVNTNEIEPLKWGSPKETFAGQGIEISEALGRVRDSTDLLQRHPFDVEILRVPPGKAPYPHHAHSAQWEFYHVISGTGILRFNDERVAVGPGDACICKPGDAHQFINDGTEDLVVYVVADNPVGEACYYPDSEKWSHPLPERRVMRGDALDYFDGEE